MQVKQGLRRFWWVGGLLLLGGGAAVTLAGKGHAPVEASATAEMVYELSPADLARVAQQDFQRVLQLSGEISPLRQTQLAAEVDGVVSEVLVRPGDSVKAGQVLMRFSTLDLQQLQAQSEASLARARAQLANQQRTQERNRQLLERNFISQSAYDSSVSEGAALQAEVKASSAQLALARQNFGKAVVRAPFAGVISQRQIEPGQRVGMGAPLLGLVEMSQLELKLSVPVRALGGIAVGQPVEFHVDGFAKPFAGSVSRIAPQADASRSVPVYIQVPNADGSLRGGMYARADLALSSLPAASVLPSVSVHDERGEQVVYLVQNNRIVRQVVSIAERNPSTGMLALAKPLPAGSVVLRVAPPGKGNGQQVKLPAKF